MGTYALKNRKYSPTGLFSGKSSPTAEIRPEVHFLNENLRSLDSNSVGLVLAQHRRRVLLDDYRPPIPDHVPHLCRDLIRVRKLASEQLFLTMMLKCLILGVLD